MLDFSELSEMGIFRAVLKNSTFYVDFLKKDSFLRPKTAGSGNPDCLWSQPLPQVKPVLLVPQSYLKVQRLGCNRCPIS